MAENGTSPSKARTRPVEFVGVRITSDFLDNKQIMVQPAAYVDPLVEFESIAPAGATSTTITVFTTPKLSR